MTEMTLIKWLLFIFMMATVESQSIFKKDSYSIGEGMMKTILESCYAKKSFANPVIIFGKFNTLIDGVSIIRINDFLNVTNYEHYRSLKFKASSVVLMSEPPDQLISNLKLLRRTKLWNNMVPFFIIEQNTVPCTNSKIFLSTMWGMEILNSIYICPNLIDNTPEIHTLNPITNYAPYPWKKIDELDDLNIFRQNYDANISCAHLTYDKTKILDGYNILVGSWKPPGSGWAPGKYSFKEYASCRIITCRVIQNIITALNASGEIEIEMGFAALKKRHSEGSIDVIVQSYALDSFLGFPYIFPHFTAEILAVVKLRAEVSTLDKIRHLWSTPFLIVAGFALALLFLILMIKGRSFGSALLDVTRFLTYTSIQTDNRYHSFRIYFTTMLILIVISNGVFQSKIAAFLTTRERGRAPESIDELVKLEYQMYTIQQSLEDAQRGCPRCEFRRVSTSDECIELVLNGTKNVCVIDKTVYETKYILRPLTRVRKSFYPQLANLKCRLDWPLRDRFNHMVMRVVEAGLPDYWRMQSTHIPKAKREAMEAEWSSAQYRPVELKKLEFAFKLLAAGLSLATIVFFLELCWARYVNP